MAHTKFKAVKRNQ